MKEVMVYESNDGKLFRSCEECVEHEVKRLELSEIELKYLGEPFNGIDFSNGKGYIQQDKTAVAKAMMALVEHANIETKWSDAMRENPFDYRNSFVGRILCDRQDGSYRVWYRFMCMDSLYREWGQPYYADNGGECFKIRDGLQTGR